MHACVLTLNIDQTEHAFLHSQGHVRKMATNHYANYTLPNMRHCTADMGYTRKSNCALTPRPWRVTYGGASLRIIQVKLPTAICRIYTHYIMEFSAPNGNISKATKTLFEIYEDVKGTCMNYYIFANHVENITIV